MNHEATVNHGGTVNHARKSAAYSGREPGQAVKTDQAGYLPEFPKIGLIAGEAAGTFAVRDAVSGEQAMTGLLSAAIADANSGDTVRRADFSALTAAGTYVLEADGAGASHPFEIRENVYEHALRLLLRSYTLQRSGVAIDDPDTGLKLAPGHPQDAQAEIYYTDEVVHKGQTIDVSGGWYDAGDYGKYTPTAAISVGQMLIAYEMNPRAFAKGQMNLPQGLDANDAERDWPDLLKELKFELDWMTTMQRPDGAVYLKVSGDAWSGFVPPSEDVQKRYVYGLSTYATGQYAAALATASRVYKPFDAAYSAKLLELAVKAQNYLNAHPEAIFRKDEGQGNGSGGYEKDTDEEERFWALAELFRTTGDSAYSRVIEEHFRHFIASPPITVNWGNAQALGQWALYRAAHTPTSWKEQLASAFRIKADELLRLIKADGYLNALTADEYVWASAKACAANGVLLVWAYEMHKDGMHKDQMHKAPRYLEGALEQLHYVFGRTATGYSYVSGVGTRFPRNSHHRLQGGTGILLLGLVVGGPNRTGDDAVMTPIKGTVPPAKAYVDSMDSYTTNEYAIDYNAPVVMLASYFCK